DDDVGLEAAQQLERRAPVLGGLDRIARLQQHPQRLARAQLVVDDQHAPEGACGGAHEVASGSVTRKWSSWRPCRTASCPPTASTRRWLTAGPTSIRLSCTIWTGSNTRCSFSAGTDAVREPTRIRTPSPPSRSACRATETDTRAWSGGGVCARYPMRDESALRS